MDIILSMQNLLEDPEYEHVYMQADMIEALCMQDEEFYWNQVHELVATRILDEEGDDEAQENMYATFINNYAMIAEYIITNLHNTCFTTMGIPLHELSYDYVDISNEKIIFKNVKRNKDEDNSVHYREDRESQKPGSVY